MSAMLDGRTGRDAPPVGEHRRADRCSWGWSVSSWSRRSPVARRTASSMDRFERRHTTADVEINAGETTAGAAARVPSGHPASPRWRCFARNSRSHPEDVRFPPGRGPARRRLRAHRRSGPARRGRPRRRADELTIGESLDEPLGVTSAIASVQLVHAGAIASNDGRLSTTRRTSVLIHVPVVGIVRRPLDLGGRGTAGGVVVPTPAFVAEYRRQIGSFSGNVLRVRTEHGGSDVPGVVAGGAEDLRRRRTFLALGLAIEGRAPQTRSTSPRRHCGSSPRRCARGSVAIAIALARHMAPRPEQDTLRSLVFAVARSGRRHPRRPCPSRSVAASSRCCSRRWCLRSSRSVSRARRNRHCGFRRRRVGARRGLRVALAGMVARGRCVWPRRRRRFAGSGRVVAASRSDRRRNRAGLPPTVATGSASPWSEDADAAGCRLDRPSSARPSACSPRSLRSCSRRVSIA